MTEKAKKVLEIRVYTCIKKRPYFALNPYLLSIDYETYDT